MEGELFIMLINIHDSHLEKVGFLDSESPGAPGFFNDVEHHYLAEGASTFTFSVNKKKNGILQDYCQFLNEYAYFSFSENGEDHFYSVGTVDEDNDTTFTVTCYSLNLELRLEQCDPLENTASHNIQWYFDQMELINNTQITIGINEVSDLSRVIKYDGQESKLARLISLIRNFDAEFEFITKSNNDGTLDKIILNIYKQNDGVNFQGVGTKRDDVILTLDTNITGVSRTVDKTQIFNATTITGADGLTWNSSEFSYVNSDGVEEFYKRKNADTAFAPLSLAKYPSQIQSSTGDRWIRKDFQTEYTNVNDMWGYAVSQFKKFAYGIVTYKVSVSSLLVNSEVGNGLPLKIGDTVTISDDNFIDSNGVRGLILSARVSEMEISRTDPTKNTLVFSNYIRLQSQISNDLQSQLSNLVEAATPYRAELTTTNGTQFKNGTGSTTLSAHIFKGSATTETIADSYEWSKDGTVVAPTQTITVDASGVADKAVYSFKATVAGKVVASQSVTITNVYDGIAGKDGVGIKTTTITYAVSTSGTTAPSSGWTSQVPNVPAGQYLWTKTVWAYTDNTIETGYSVAMNGKTPYFHTAWSYSADGTDGFTTVYPNLNLLVNSSAKTKDGFFKNFDKVEDGYGEVTIKGNNSYFGINMWDGFSIQPGDYKPGDTYTMSMDVMFTSWNIPAGVYLEEFWIGQRYTHNSDWSINSWKRICYIDLPKDPSKMLNQWIRITYTSTIPPHEDPSVHTESIFLTKFSGSGEASFTLRIRKPKQEPGSTATPWMPSASEVTTADWPSHIGQYTDFTQADSTKPSDYTWSLIRGNDGKDGLAGKDGVGLRSTTVTYTISSSGTVTPTTGWTSQVPTLVKGQYLWTKTVWNYSDGTSESGYTVSYIAKDGNNGHDGIAGKDGVGIKTTTITYAGSTSGTTAPSSGWTSQVPNVPAGQYLWTKTVWAYTDNTIETGYSVGKMGNTGPAGPPGSNGEPGKIVSDTEPSTRFKGLTWKYSGTTDLTASDGTVIKPNTEYYYNGTHWVINYFSVNNFEAESITSDKIDGKNLTITDGEFINKTTNGPVSTSTEIKDNHIAISKKDGTVNTRHDIALDSEQGLAQKFTNINTGFYRTAGINYQGPFTSDSDGNYAQLTPQGTKLSTDVPWTKLSLMNNFNGNIEYSIINGTVYISASGVGVPAMTAGQWKQAAQLPTGSSAIPIRANRIAAGDSGDGLSWALLSNQAGGIFIRCSANKAPTPNLFNATLPYPIG